MKSQKTGSSQLSSRAKNAFWSVVEDCLVEILKLSRVEAHNRARELRTTLDNPPPELIGDLFYHEEPFYVACDLANNELDPAQHRALYDTILQRHGW